MSRWFLSYNSQDDELARALGERIRERQPLAKLFFAPRALQAGRPWQAQIADAVAEADIFVLLVGPKGLGPWQVPEYQEAYDWHVKKQLPIVMLLKQGVPAPGLDYLRLLHWIVTPDILGEDALGRLLDAAEDRGGRPAELWRHTAPYRGLQAMTEADSDYFLGRRAETEAVLRQFATHPDQMPLLLGNSGVGKSSIAQAGVIAALKRESWPVRVDNEDWPTPFRGSRRWCFLKVTPGTEPVGTLVDAFLAVWRQEETQPDWVRKRKGWLEGLLDGGLSLRDLMDATARRLEVELHESAPPAYLIYVDQGEELYARSEAWQRLRFSALLAEGLTDPRLYAMMSLRADFTGEFHKDEVLYERHRRVDVPPLRESGLRVVIEGAAKLLGVAFESSALPGDLARRAYEDSVKDAGALPLLSYLLEDMWKTMQERGDGVMRLPAHAVDLGGVLVERADRFLHDNAVATDRLKRIFTGRLANLRPGEEPTRRRAFRREFDDADWALVSNLADSEHRLLVTVVPEWESSAAGGHAAAEAFAEVAHEALFRRWGRLRDWVKEESEFLLWRTELEADRKRWEEAEVGGRDDALLLRGLTLTQAEGWLAQREADLDEPDRLFIRAASAADRRRRRSRMQILTIAVAVLLVLLGIAGAGWFQADQGQRALKASTESAQYEQKKAEEARDEALRNQSLFIASLAGQQTQTGRAQTAMLLALEALPGRGHKRPFVPAAEAALYDAVMGAHEQAVMRGHTGDVTAVGFSLQGPVTGSRDGTVRAWNREGALIRTLVEGGPVRAILSRPDGSLVVAAGRDIRVWPVQADAPARLLASHPSIVLCAGTAGETILSGGQDGSVRLATAEGVSARELSGHSDSVEGCALSRDGSVAATASRDGTVRIWRALSGEQLAVLAGDPQGMGDVAVSAEGNLVAAAGWSGSVYLWHKEGANWALSVLAGHNDAVQAVAFSPDTTRLASASWDGNVKLWSTANGRELKSMSGGREKLDNLAFNAAGDLLVAGARNGKAWIWSERSGQLVGILAGHNGRITATSFDPTSSSVLTGSSDGTARLWRVYPQKVAELKTPGRFATGFLLGRSTDPVVSYGWAGPALAWSPFGQWERELLAGAQLNAVGSPTDLADNEESAGAGDNSEPDNANVCADMAKDSAIIVTCGQFLDLWTLGPGGMVVRSTRLPMRDPIAARFVPGEARLVALSRSGRLVLFEEAVGTWRVVREAQIDASDRASMIIASGRPNVLILSGSRAPLFWSYMSDDVPWPLMAHGERTSAATFGTDGDVAVTGGWDAMIHVYDLRRDHEPRQIRGHAAIASLALRPDDAVLAAGFWDGTIVLFDLASGRAIRTLSGHGATVTQVAFTRDGQRMLSSSLDGTARVWNAQTAQPLAVLKDGSQGVVAAAFSRDDLFIGTLSDDGVPRLWRNYPDLTSLVQEAERLVHGDVLSPADRARFFLDGRP